MLKKINKMALFAAGTLFGSAGFKILRSKDAKNIYKKAVALGLRGYDSLVKTGEKIQSDFEDIVYDAKKINEEKRLEDITEEKEF